ncbi:MAG: hypothetical protein L6R35_006768, partial [Caloplaca aegaea]
MALDDPWQDSPRISPTLFSLIQAMTPRVPRTAVLAGQAYACISQGGSLPVIPIVALSGIGLWPDEWSPHTWPIFFGRFSAVSEKGLRGFWGTWWHQTNRYLSIPGRSLSQALGIPTESSLGYMLQVISAFVLSGVMHMGLIPPQPLSTAMTAMEMRSFVASFFWLQILGIGIELGVLKFVGRYHDYTHFTTLSFLLLSQTTVITIVELNLNAKTPKNIAYTMIQITFLRAAVAAVSLFSLSNAQVTTPCNPLQVTCPNDKGLATNTYFIDFTTVKSWPSEWILADYSNVTFGPQGAEFTFAKRYDAPTMWTDFKFFFGRAEFVVKAAKGTGIVSSMVLLSADLDEVDWEFLGGATSTVQTNYFGKGYTGSYNRSTTPEVASPQTIFYTYALDWSPTALVWSIDGKAVRTLRAADADGNGEQYPQSPMKVSLGVWDAGDPDAATQVWGGGVTPIPPPEPYTMFVKSVNVWNTNPAEEYQWTDKSGDMDSIKMIQDVPDPVPSSSSSSSKSVSAAQTLSLGFTTSATTAMTKTMSAMSPSGMGSSSSRMAAGGVLSSSSKAMMSTRRPMSSATPSSGMKPYTSSGTSSMAS